ncbi:MAG: hypothetical protein U5J64_12710 [Halobacteriales archaeon]|nr:hypothetical protein [Halobacteriales archaeon]
MPAKITERATDYREVDRWDGGVGWIAHPDEYMQRASHVLKIDEGVWLIDPLDAEGIDDLIAEYGEVAGVVLLSNYHTRDADVFAERHGVSVHLPEGINGIAEDLDAPVERMDVGDTLGGYELLEVARRGKLWQEYALYDGKTLVVSESVGTAPYFLVGGERLGVPILVRLTPPRESLGDLQPDRLLTGHGEGIDENAAEALEDALANSRRRFPRALLSHGGKQIRTLTAAVRT